MYIDELHLENDLKIWPTFVGAVVCFYFTHESKSIDFFSLIFSILLIWRDIYGEILLFPGIV